MNKDASQGQWHKKGFSGCSLPAKSVISPPINKGNNNKRYKNN